MLAGMQGVVVSFDPSNHVGIVMVDTPDRTQYPLGPSAVDDSLFAMVRQGQRVNFDIDEKNRAVNLRIGSEVDMGISTARV